MYESMMVQDSDVRSKCCRKQPLVRTISVCWWCICGKHLYGHAEKLSVT